MPSVLPTFLARLEPEEMAEIDRVLALARERTGLPLSRSDLLRLATPVLYAHFAAMPVQAKAKKTTRK